MDLGEPARFTVRITELTCASWSLSRLGPVPGRAQPRYEGEQADLTLKSSSSFAAALILHKLSIFFFFKKIYGTNEMIALSNQFLACGSFSIKVISFPGHNETFPFH